nr:hypothetical protein [Tanacetum cinerariifolium]
MNLYTFMGLDDVEEGEKISSVLGNVRKRVRGPTFMPKVWTKTEEDRISVQFNEYRQPVDETTSTARVKKDYYDPTLPFHKQITLKPKRVLASQWKRLVKSWNKGKSRRLSDKNKANGAKKKMMQVMGKTSYAQVREKQKVILGREPTRKELFRACFSKDGITQNVEAANAIVGLQVYLKSILNSEIVAKGWIRSLNPDEVVGSEEIGPN